MSEKINKELLELLSQVTTQAKGCFYTRLDERGKEFIDACVEVRKTGRHISADKTSEVLGRVFKVQVSETSVRRHLKEACQCQTKTTN